MSPSFLRTSLTSLLGGKTASVLTKALGLLTVLENILQATPEVRRGFIEEAAGVLKHRKRKEKALRKLDAMQANLTRLQDLTLRYGLLETLDADHFYPTLETALAAAQALGALPPEGEDE
mgnify:CR=1 FL=1